MRKGLLITCLAFVITGFSLSLVNAQSACTAASSTNAKAQELAVDNECITSKFLNQTPAAGTSSNYGSCSRICPRECLYSGADYSTRKDGYCVLGTNTQVYMCCTLTSTEGVNNPLDKVNFLGIEVDRAPLVLVRRVMLGVFAAAGIVIIAFGIVAMYKFSFSQGQQEKVQEAIKIFKSLIIGAVITFSGVVLIQILALVTGVTGNLADFNFLPRTGRVVFLYQDDLGKACLVEQTFMTGGEEYYCQDGVWKTAGQVGITPAPTPDLSGGVQQCIYNGSSIACSKGAGNYYNKQTGGSSIICDVPGYPTATNN